ncbi:MAG: cyanobacteria-specific GntR-like domain containing transcriptional regulator [Cyanobacteria bacterium RYN_339]|nr:cyanobacteria-specific GntR-like domain containing transcriptional regulator [Cyanobacteria bacterium RYN_339]
MKVAINRDSQVPIHDQLVQQIALHIAAGVLRPGERLPSIRDLARRLDVHPNTVSAVYKALEGYGVVTVRQGSGVRVLEPESRSAEAPSLVTAAERFVADARAAGHPDGEIARAFEGALRPDPIDRVIVVDPHPDFHPLYLHELGDRLRLPVQCLTLQQLAAVPARELAGAAIAASMYHLAATREAVGDERRVVVFQVGTGEEVLAQCRALPAGQTLALVSVSPTMLEMARELVSAMRGEDLLILEATPADPDQLRSVVRLADVVACDGPSTATVRALTSKPVATMELLPAASMRALEAQLPR